jgi:hypothetical protein
MLLKASDGRSWHSERKSFWAFRLPRETGAQFVRSLNWHRILIGDVMYRPKSHFFVEQSHAGKI